MNRPSSPTPVSIISPDAQAPSIGRRYPRLEHWVARWTHPPPPEKMGRPATLPLNLPNLAVSHVLLLGIVISMVLGASADNDSHSFNIRHCPGCGTLHNLAISLCGYQMYRAVAISRSQ
ncbi:hypothetical protein BT63DRAFT_428667 [Microthyrium microscopicum]|uniref:Uncharacterized protein n=1 Tax=Microthyrium microscopicum TaxID=703497 RepID=A0A6A6U295_9PEZI|nr:hypothetical protein BT63DRAFT_428667 [Microthyrium microscopicum]